MLLSTFAGCYFCPDDNVDSLSVSLMAEIMMLGWLADCLLPGRTDGLRDG